MAVMIEQVGTTGESAPASARDTRRGSIPPAPKPLVTLRHDHHRDHHHGHRPDHRHGFSPVPTHESAHHSTRSTKGSR